MLPPTDISEEGLETLIMGHMTGMDGLAPVAEDVVMSELDACALARQLPAEPVEPKELAEETEVEELANE